MVRGSACAIGNMAYFNTFIATNKVYCYNCLSKQWTKLSSDLLTYNSVLVVISDLLTTVGGYNSNKLFTFNGKEWVEKYPPMPTKRHSPAAVCSGHSLVVAGGHNEQYQSIPTVEVMDTSTLQWFTAACLPKGMHRASMTKCGDDLYLLGMTLSQLMSTVVPSNPCYSLVKYLERPLLHIKPASGTELLEESPHHRKPTSGIESLIFLCSILQPLPSAASLSVLVVVRTRRRLTVYTVTTLQHLSGRSLEQFP